MLALAKQILERKTPEALVRTLPGLNFEQRTGKQLKADKQRMIEADRAPLRSPNPLAARKRAGASDALTETLA
jgi:hypothetical protein